MWHRSKSWRKQGTAANQPVTNPCKANLFGSILKAAASGRLTGLCLAVLLQFYLLLETNKQTNNSKNPQAPQPTLEVLRQEDPKFKVRMNYIERP